MGTLPRRTLYGRSPSSTILQPRNTTLTTQRSDSELTCLPQERRGCRRILGIRHRARRLCRRAGEDSPAEPTSRSRSRSRRSTTSATRRTPSGVHGRVPNVKIVHNKAADLGRTPARTTSRSSARRASPISRPSRWTGSPRRCSTPIFCRGARQREGPLAQLEGSRCGRLRRPARGLRPRHRPQAICYRADLLRPPASLHSRRGRRALRRGLGRLLRRRRPVQGRHRQADDGRRELGVSGHGEPDRVPLRRARRHGRRDRQPGARGRLQPVVERADANSAYAGSGRQLEHLDGERRVRLDALPRLDARHHRGQRPRGHRLGGRQRRSRRRRQLGPGT